MNKWGCALTLVAIVTLITYFSKATCPKFGNKCPVSPTTAPTALAVAPAVVKVAAPMNFTTPPDLSTPNLARLATAPWWYKRDDLKDVYNSGNTDKAINEQAAAFYLPIFKTAFEKDGSVTFSSGDSNNDKISKLLQQAPAAYGTPESKNGNPNGIDVVTAARKAYNLG